MIARVVVGATLLLAGTSKLLNRDGFRRSLAAYKIVSHRLQHPIAILLISAELLIGTTLLLKIVVTPSTYLAISLLTLFSAALISKLAFGEFDQNCGCFSFIGNRTTGWTSVLRNLGLIGLAGLSIQRSIRGNLVLAWLFCLLMLLMSFAPLPTRVGARSSRHPGEQAI